MATFQQVNANIGPNAMARAISAFSDQEYTDAVRIAGTELVGSDARISGSDEDYFGTIRWTRPLGDITYAATEDDTTGASTPINIASEGPQEGLKTGVSHDSSQYIKTMRTMGASQYNVTQVLTTAPNAIEKVSRDFGVTRARDADATLMSMLKGVTQAEIARRIDDGAGTVAAAAAGNRYGQGLGQSATDKRNSGFYFDVNGPRALGVTQTDNSGAVRNNSLISAITSTLQGARAGEALWEAASAAYGDLEPEFFYLLVGTQTYHSIRAANLLDDRNSISDGNIDVPTLLSGKFRVLVSRSLDSGFDFTPTGNTTGATDAVNQGSTNTSYLMLPGALYQSDLSVPNPVAFDADESVGRGAGEREIWYRWGNIYHPRGYTWSGATSAFATNTLYEAPASWQRKESTYSLGVLPIFHG